MPIPLQELSHRVLAVRHNITQIESQISMTGQQVNASRGTPQEVPLMQRMKELEVELTKAREYSQRLIEVYTLRILILSYSNIVAH